MGRGDWYERMAWSRPRSRRVWIGLDCTHKPVCSSVFLFFSKVWKKNGYPYWNLEIQPARTSWHHLSSSGVASASCWTAARPGLLSACYRTLLLVYRNPHRRDRPLGTDHLPKKPFFFYRSAIYLIVVNKIDHHWGRLLDIPVEIVAPYRVPNFFRFAALVLLARRLAQPNQVWSIWTYDYFFYIRKLKKLQFFSRTEW